MNYSPLDGCDDNEISYAKYQLETVIHQQALLLGLVLASVALLAGSANADPDLPIISSRITNVVVNFKAIGNGSTDNAGSINAAITAISKAGGGTVEIPANGTLSTYLSGPITFKTNVNLQIDTGATLQMLPETSWPNASTPFIYGSNLHDCEISGGGTIDGQGSAWWACCSCDSCSRPNFIQFDHTQRLLIQGVSTNVPLNLQNPPTFHIYLKSSDGNVTIQNIRINTSSGSPNTDGMDITSTNVLIRNCYISDGDDNLEIGGSNPAYNITVSNCTFGSGHGVSIGSYTSGGVSNLVVSNCTWVGTQYGIKGKSDTDRGGVCQYLTYSDLIMSNVNFTVAFYSYYNSIGSPSSSFATTPSTAATTSDSGTLVPIWRNITISNLTATGIGGDVAGFLWGLPQAPVTNLTLCKVNISAPNKTFCMYNARGVNIIDSNLTAPNSSTNTLTLYNAEFSITNSAPNTNLVTIIGLGSPSNSVLSLFNSRVQTPDASVLGTNPPLTLVASTFAVSNNASFGGNSTLNFGLGTNTTGVIVSSNLTLDGTLNIANAGGFIYTTYPLFTYGGTLTYNGLAIGTTPNANFTYTVSTNTPGEVDLVAYWSNAPPIASFSGSPAHGPVPLAVTFLDTSIGIISNRFWDFGDGNTTNIAATSVAHTYGAGAHTVTLIESGPYGISTNIQPNFIVAVITNTISTASSPPVGGTASGSGTYSNGATATVCAVPNPCYGFVSWTDQNSNVVSTSACYAFTVTSDQSLTANFSLVSYTVTTSSSPTDGGSTSGGGIYICGSNTTVCATVNPCHSFAYWSDQNSNVVSTSTCYAFTVTTNESLVANYNTFGPYTITISNSLAGSGTITGGGTYACGSNATLCATPNSCSLFLNWTLNGSVVSTSACYSFTVAGNQTLVANFSVYSYTITTSNSLAGSGTITGGGTYPCGSNVTLCATPNSCYSFVNWTDQNSNVVSTSTCYSFMPTTNLAMVANFVVNGSLGGNATLTNLWSFTGGVDGANPVSASLIQATDTCFYGTTGYGGANGFGTVFRITPAGVLTSLWSFANGTDGASPFAPLVQASDGNFYGTTSGSGSGSSANGTVFVITPSGALTTLWSFSGGSDGSIPFGGLLQGADGNLYGTTSAGGANGNGAVYRVTTSGTLTTLWSFSGGSDGAAPFGGLVQGADGNLYGTTSAGGANADGTVYRITPGGNLTNLWSFTGGTDGANPNAGLVWGTDGNLYGTTVAGGASGNGAVFRITPTGTLTNLGAFQGCLDGATPYTPLVQGSDGNFYGTTYGSGSGPSAYGTVFRITPTGALTSLWSFAGNSDGANPYAGLVQGVDGSFYGTTLGSGSGPSHIGNVFRLSVPLAPPANQVSRIQAAAGNLIFTIPSVAGETYQLQYTGSLTLSNWANIDGVSLTNSIGGRLSLTNFGGALQPQGFYRFAITP
ncbi:MAG TPA: choice-of-anchor tandem repeat GloVer-containing protein [Verrucomicrobiae bacterium]|nr:choice-of-anchor tandem repeat GloVer-containing protein [Verrucomicrobiae bacterium]